MGALSSVDSFESADQVLRQNLLPNIQVEDALVSDALASQYSPDAVVESLPPVDRFPLYGAQPSTDPQTVYIEIWSSSEKSNALKESERWLVDVAEAFNGQQVRISSGQVIQVGVRRVPSGLAAQMIAANAAQPNGFTPANGLWMAWLESEGVTPEITTDRLVPNQAGFVVDEATYQALSAGGEPDFETVLDAVLSGNLAIGYPNPYVSTTALNLLYTICWHAAGHNETGQPLTVANLQSPDVSSVFDTFQNQVVITTPTAPDLMQLFIRDPDKLQAFPLEYQDYVNLRKLPGFERTAYIPFGVPHYSPLAGFEWNTPAQREALQKLTDFAISEPMQQLAATKGFELTAYLQGANLPPMPSGEVLKAAQAFWKQRKDGGRSVYMMIVIDTSGSMEGDRLQAVQAGPRVAIRQINTGNQVGLMTVSDAPARLVNIAPSDTLQQQRLLAAIDSLRADGGTAMYDAMMVALADLLDQQKADPDGRFYMLLLTDGAANEGLTFSEVQEILRYSDVRVYPIAYGEVDQQELQAIATLRESTVQEGTPENIEELLKGLFQTSL